MVGDEIAIKCPAEPPHPEGKSRGPDFVL